eukprot:TRINITY_DN60009_c0_g1_i1.p2 TRINITY_DN60009_c0_g1~~TRINITY_DN60009_c0_g1_i1.p2  ORF type:complete len:365 (+),score=32.63 TRINITY_DN60009_c0_g1_i1:86-1180(+)
MGNRGSTRAERGDGAAGPAGSPAGRQQPQQVVYRQPGNAYPGARGYPGAAYPGTGYPGAHGGYHGGPPRGPVTMVHFAPGADPRVHMMHAHAHPGHAPPWAPAGPAQPAFATPDMQSTETLRNHANLAKPSVSVTRSAAGELVVSFSLDTTAQTSVEVHIACVIGSQAGGPSLRPQPGAPAAATAEAAVGNAVRIEMPPVACGALGESHLRYDSSRPSHLPLVIALWYENEGRKQGQVTCFCLGGAGEPKPTVVRQMLFVGDDEYLLEDLYGFEDQPVLAEVADPVGEEGDMGKLCVVCMEAERDTTAMPCRHMCLCSECAGEFRKKSNKCPVCRAEIDSLITLRRSSPAPSPTPDLAEQDTSN